MTDTNATPVVLTPDMLGDDDLGRLMVANLVGFSETISRAQKVCDAANADDAKLLVINLRDSHPKFAEYQALIEKAEAIVKVMDSDNASKVEMPTEAQVTEAVALIDAERENAKPTIEYVRKAYADFDLSEIIPANLRAKRGRKPGSTVDGANRRPRLANIRVADAEGNVLKTFSHGADKPEDNATFSTLAKWLTVEGGAKVDVKSLQEHAFAEAKTEDLSTVDGPVEFGVTIGERHFDIALEARSA